MGVYMIVNTLMMKCRRALLQDSFFEGFTS